MNTQKWLQQAEQAAQSAAATLQKKFMLQAGVRSSDGRDIKTEADLEAEAIIKSVLSSTGIPILAEESADQEQLQCDGLRWLVDPLDGTMNFSRGFPQYAVSIALMSGERPILGVVYDICRDLCYKGICGEGAWQSSLNATATRKLSVSTISEQSQAILATGFPVARSYDATALNRFIQHVQCFKKIRMIGSAAMSLAMVANGSFDAYYEEDIMLWDVAAGLAIIDAAGGQIQITPGKRPFSVNALASNGVLPFHL